MPTLPDEWINPSDVLDEDETDLVGCDANAGSVMAFVNRALKHSGNPIAVQNAYRHEAMSGSYDHLLAVSLAYLGDR